MCLVTFITLTAIPYAQELEFFYPSKGDFRLQPTTKYVNSSCCIIKPHAVKAGFAGDILSAIKASDFEITDFLVVSIICLRTVA